MLTRSTLFEFLTLKGVVEGEICGRPAKIRATTTEHQAVLGYQVWINDGPEIPSNPSPEETFSEEYVASFKLSWDGSVRTNERKDENRFPKWFRDHFEQKMRLDQFYDDKWHMIRLADALVQGPLTTSSDMTTVIAWINLLASRVDTMK